MWLLPQRHCLQLRIKAQREVGFPVVLDQVGSRVFFVPRHAMSTPSHACPDTATKRLLLLCSPCASVGDAHDQVTHSKEVWHPDRKSMHDDDG